jgi:hypothetical protein
MLLRTRLIAKWCPHIAAALYQCQVLPVSGSLIGSFLCPYRVCFCCSSDHLSSFAHHCAILSAQFWLPATEVVSKGASSVECVLG